jgi:RNA polymerase sigma-70 factor, ECF subfamily
VISVTIVTSAVQPNVFLVQRGVSAMATAYIGHAGITATPAQAAARDSSSDEALIRLVAQRDQSAMRALYARHRVRVYRWLLRLVHDEGVAEDLLSEAFLDVWRHAASFEGRSSVSTWLLAIARNKALSARRRRMDAELDEERASNVPDTADDPEVALQKKSRAELLRQSIARLSPEHREVIDLVYYHGKAVTEVAEIAGINKATVKTRMFYARKRLAELVATA